MQVEDTEVERDHFRVVLRKKVVDGRFQLFIIEGLGKRSLNGTFSIVGYGHAVAESDEEFLLSFHEPDLEKVLANGVARAEFESFVDKGDLVGDRFFFHKNRAEIPACGEAGDGCFIKLAFVVPNPGEHFIHDGGVDFLIDFVCVHGLSYLRRVNTPHG